MKKLLFPDDKLANRISYYHLLLLLGSLPFNLFFSHIILISFGAHTLINLNREHFKQVFKWRNLLLQSVFVVTVISTIYSDNKAGAFSAWAVQLPILLLPIFFSFTNLDLKKYRHPLLLGFSVVCTGVVLYLFADALFTIKYYKLPVSAIFSQAFTNHNFTEPMAIHATFFSMQLLMALVYMVLLFIKQRAVYLKLFYAFCIVVLTAGLFQLCAKSVLFCLFVVINLALPFFLWNGLRRVKFIAIAMSVSLLLGCIVLRSTALKERLVTDLITDVSAPVKGETTEPRAARWEVARDLIAQSPIIGYGAGTEVDLLHQEYFRRKYYSSFLNNLNVHNEYLSFLIKSGILGLMVYFATLAFGFKKAINHKDLLFF